MPKGKLLGDIFPPKGRQTAKQGKIQLPKCKSGFLERPSSPEEMLLTVKVLHNYLLSLLDVLGPKVRGLVPEGAWALNPMTSAHVRRGTMQRQPREGHGPRQAKTRVVLTSPGAPGASRRCQKLEGASREPAERAQPCPHLDSGPPASRPGEVTVLLSTSQCRGLGHRSPRTLIQETHEKPPIFLALEDGEEGTGPAQKGRQDGRRCKPGRPRAAPHFPEEAMAGHGPSKARLGRGRPRG